MFKDYFDIYVGIVNGNEKVYKNANLGNIEVLNGENKVSKYIYIDKFPCDNEQINEYLLEHKKELLERGIKKFNENNWFEWGAPRNIKTINKNIGKDCIYIYNLIRTKNNNIAFVDKVRYFGGGLIMLLPKKECPAQENCARLSQPARECNLNNIVAYLNSDVFKNNFIYSGRFKIGHRQISNFYIPNEYL